MDQNEARYMAVILRHKELVGKYLALVSFELMRRAVEHDFSKFGPEEFPAYAMMLPKFEQAEYGTPEYQACLDGIEPALEHHFSVNSHHPEFYANGVNDMTLIDLIEMVCDWIAAAQSTGGVLRLDIQKRRFDIDDTLFSIIERTATDLTEDE